ncbi:MAG: helix-turn-helix domain-containing protein [Bacillota bacterium]
MKLYTVAEVMRMLKVRKSYVYELIYTGQLRAVRLSERRLRIPNVHKNSTGREAGFLFFSKPGAERGINPALFLFREVICAVQFYTVSEVAKMLRVRKGYVYELVAQGRLHALRLSERRLRIPKEALEEFIRQETARCVAK